MINYDKNYFLRNPFLGNQLKNNSYFSCGFFVDCAGAGISFLQGPPRGKGGGWWRAGRRRGVSIWGPCGRRSCRSSARCGASCGTCRSTAPPRRATRPPGAGAPWAPPGFLCRGPHTSVPNPARCVSEVSVADCTVRFLPCKLVPHAYSATFEQWHSPSLLR